MARVIIGPFIRLVSMTLKRATFVDVKLNAKFEGKDTKDLVLISRSMNDIPIFTLQAYGTRS